MTEGWDHESQSWMIGVRDQQRMSSGINEANCIKVLGILNAVARELRVPLHCSLHPFSVSMCRPPEESAAWLSWLFRAPSGQRLLEKVTSARLLTPEEIHLVLLPFSRGDDMESSMATAGAVNFPEIWKNTMRSVHEALFASLTALSVPPAAHFELGREIVRQFMTSIVAKGEAVGIRAAEAFGQPLTQMALNAFHSSGALNTIGEDNIVKMRELFNNSLQMKNETCRVGFTNVNTLHDALHRKKDITDTRLNKFFKREPQLMDRDTSSSSSVAASDLDLLTSLRATILASDEGSMSPMIEPDSDLFLRLSIDLDIMYQYRVTLNDIVRQIEDSCILGNVVRMRVYPTHVGLIDVFPIGAACISREHSRVFLTAVLLPELINIRMCGIPGIENMIPEEVNVCQSVIDAFVHRSSWSSSCASVDHLDAMWTHLAFVNRCKLSLHRLRTLDVVRLLRALTNGRVLQIECMERCYSHSEKYIVYALAPLTLHELATKCGVASVDTLVEDNRKTFEQVLSVVGSSASLDASLPVAPKTLIEVLQAYSALPELNTIFVSTVGSNLEALLMRDDVDTSVTYSNNIRLVNELFGIEAARSVLITEFWKLLERSGSKISPRHVLLVTDFMTNRGVVLGLTSSGLSLQPSATLTLMTFERPADHIFRMGMTGNEETINSVSSCVMTGQPPMVGTGASGIVNPRDSLEGAAKDHQERFLAGAFPFGRGRQRPVAWKPATSKQPAKKRAVSARLSQSMSSAVPDSVFDEFDSTAQGSPLGTKSGQRLQPTLPTAASSSVVDASMFDEFDEMQPPEDREECETEGVAVDADLDTALEADTPNDAGNEAADLQEVAGEDLFAEGVQEDDEVADLDGNDDDFDMGFDDGGDDGLGYGGDGGGNAVDSSWNE